MSDKISVIVPVYNGEKYLVRCLDSLQRQTWQNMEYLLIDDGSTDDSAAICKQYADNDARFQYHYKANGGVSSARNLGLDLATGDYIGFCDCDDWVDNNYYELLLEAMKKTDAEMAIAAFVADAGNTSSAVSKEGECRILSREEALTQTALGKILGSACMKLFSSKSVKNILFREDVHVGEDGLYCTETMIKTNKVVICKDVVYHYVMNGDSVMHRAFNSRMWDAVTANMLCLAAMKSMPNTVINAQRVGLIKTVCIMMEMACKEHKLEKDRYRACAIILRENKVKSIIKQLTFGEKCRYYTFKSGRVFLSLYCFVCPLLYRIYRLGKR